MKAIVNLILLLILSFVLIAQVPQAFKYQAIARDQNGQVIAEQLVSFRFSIVAGSENGESVYIETWPNVLTNNYGLINLEIGLGNPASGSFSAIDWSNGSFFVKVEIDPTNGTNWQHIGNSQLLSVPYALHAITVSNITTDASLSGGGSASEPLKIAERGVNTEHLANASVTGEKMASMGATAGQVLKWNGSMWNPDVDLSGSSQWTQTKFGLYYTGGNVGIGSNTTTSLLTLHGGSNHTDVRLFNTSSGINSSNDGLSLGLSGAAPNDAWLMNRENGSLKFGTNNLDRMTIHKSGEVQIAGDLTAGTLIMGSGYDAVRIIGIYQRIYERVDETPLRISFPGIDPRHFLVLNIEVGWIANGNGNFVPDRYRSLKDGIWYEYNYMGADYVELYVYAPDKPEYWFMPVKVTYMIFD